jgi:hypothetical protein
MDLLSLYTCPLKQFNEQCLKTLESLKNKKHDQKTVATDKTKKCCDCQEIKDLSKFDKKGFRYGKQNWHQKCKICRKANTANHYSENKSTILARNKKYYKENATRVIDQHRLYINKNEEMVKSTRRCYYNKNKSRILRAHKAYLKAYYEKNPDKKLANICRRRTSSALKKGSNIRNITYSKVVGCDVQFLYRWFDFNIQFESSMTMKNHGNYWHIDHVIPVATWDLNIKENIDRCFHWSNLSPLEAKANISKKDTVIEEQVTEHNRRLTIFCMQEKIEILECSRPITAKPTIAGTS